MSEIGSHEVRRWAILASITLLLEMFSLSAPAQADTTSEMQTWFSKEAPKLAAALAPYAPSTKTAGGSRPVVGQPVQVYSWSRTFLQGKYSAQTALTPIQKWVAPVTQGNIALGVVVYTSKTDHLYPLKIPVESGTLAPSATVGVPEVTNNQQDSTSAGITEPQNSHLAVSAEPLGAVYVLPALARALAMFPTETIKPVYDPLVDAWFIVNDERVTAICNTARDRLSGSVDLAQMQNAIQSWWGTAIVTPSPTPEASTGLPAATVFWAVALAVFVVILVLLLTWLALRGTSKLNEDVAPLEDPELIMEPAPPSTTAIPTLVSS